MKSISKYLVAGLVPAACILAAAIAGSAAKPAGSYTQTHLTANTGGAIHRDARMINAWGIASLGGSDPFWINDEGRGISELIDGKGKIVSSLPFVTIPAPAGAQGPSRPTGIVANTTGQFALPKGGSAFFIFDTLDGTIAGWNGGKNAVIVVNNSATAKYTGLAMTTGANSLLYAANTLGTIDVFDTNFKPVKTTGGFSDPNLPSGMTPYGITNMDGNLFVTYAQLSAANGVVNEFDPDGNLIRRFATNGTLDQPWAVVIAPRNFGPFSNDLLVGNFGNGTISAFNPTTGAFLGQLANANGHPLAIPGLWALVVGDNAKGVTNPNAIYFTAGPNGEQDGLFGFIVPGKGKPTPKRTPPPHRNPTATPTPPYSYY
jgi:uncharacterized protein (TIGR03118 family)